MLKLYYADIRSIKSTKSPLLSEYRKARLAKIRDEAKMRESLAAETLFNYAVRDCFPNFPLPADIICNEYGKPLISGGEFFFNLSHSDGMLLCAICDREVGVDIQRKEVCRDALVRRFFTQNEQEYVFSSCERDAAFTEIWCKKESLIKALGTGLKTPLNSFSVIGVDIIQHFTLGEYHIAVFSPDNSEIAELKEAYK